MRADHGERRAGHRALVWIPALLLAMSVQPRAWPAQEVSGSSLQMPSETGSATEGAGPPEPSVPQGHGLIRVPPPSGHLPRFGLGESSADRQAGQASSRGWWLGSTGIALVLAICGAICIASRKYRPHDSAGLVQVVGRISLTPRHSIFVIRAGRRSLLVGTGAQGAPTLLGELTEPDQAGDRAEPVGVRSTRSGARPDRPREPWDEGMAPVVDVRLEELE